MFERLTEMVDEVLAGFDPASVPLAEATAAWTALDLVERRVSGAKLLLAHRVEESGSWRSDGHRSAAEHLAALAGVSVGGARGVLDASRQLGDLPAVEDAVRSGQLSNAQAVAVTDAAAAAPQALDRLLDKAARSSLAGLREECARAKAAALPTPDARHAAIHRSRYLRKRSCPDGAAELTYRSTVDEVAEIWSVVQAHADVAFRAARRSGTWESQEAYLADGLLAAGRASVRPPAAGSAGAGAPRPVRPKEVIVRVDWDALVRGWPIDGEVCELPGIGPVPVSLVDEVLRSGDVALKTVVTRGRDVVNTAHHGRRPNAWQRTALLWLDPVCTADGCDQRARLQTDHVVPWATSKVTVLDQLQWLCRYHHDQKTAHDMTVIRRHRQSDQPP